MVILNHKYFDSIKLFEIKSIDDISSTPPNSTVRLNLDIELINYLNKNQIKFAIDIDSIKELIFASNLGAKYLITSDKNLITKAQKIADLYMFDSKIVCEISNEDEIEELALLGIDGVIFKE